MKRMLLTLLLLTGLAAAGNLWSPGLRGSWSLENAALDGSGLGNTGTVSGPSYAAGKFGRCLSYTDTLSYVDITGVTNAGTSHTVAMWVYSTDNAYRSHNLLDIQSGRIIIGWCADTAGRFGVYTGSAWGMFGATPSVNTWHHVAIVMNGATSKADAYVGGVKYGSQVTYTPAVIGGTCRIGNRFAYSTWHRTFAGLLDEVHIWNRALTQQEIQRVMMGFTP